MAYFCIPQYDTVSSNKEVTDVVNDANMKRRKLGYEFFKATHLFAVAIFMVMFFWHCGYTLTSW